MDDLITSAGSWATIAVFSFTGSSVTSGVMFSVTLPTAVFT